MIQIGGAMKFFRFALASLSLAMAANAAVAVEFKSVGTTPAILYDAPSARGKKVFVAPRGMPVEIVFTYGEWSKIRDATGDLSWVETKQLIAKRTVVVNALNVKIRAAADESSAVTFMADKGVVLEITEPVASGWVKIKHTDGQTGFVKITDVWGV